MTTSASKIRTAKKDKVTISIDADLLQLVDSFVEASNVVGVSRSSIFEQALHLWKQQMRDHFDAKYYAETAATHSVDNQSWSAVTTEAAKHTWRK